MLKATDNLTKTGVENYFGYIYDLNLNTEYFNGVRSLSAYVHENVSVNILDSYFGTLVNTATPKIVLRVSYQMLKI